jgi:signal transduction histidine kinase/CheY-like chemotaxis protein
MLQQAERFKDQPSQPLSILWLGRIREIIRAWSSRMPRALAIGLGLAAADEDFAPRLRAAQIASIVRLTPLAMGASCLNGIILMTTLASMGPIGWPLWIWSGALLALVFKYARGWWTGRRRDRSRPVKSAAIGKAVLHGGLYGALWGAVPVITFPGAPALTQLLVGCLVAGMMCAGGFVLATVPLAGVAYVLAVAAGAFFALLQGGSAVYLGLAALTAVYTGVVIINLNWNAFLFIDHFLAEARIQKEVAAREQAQAQSAHAERMIALGQLAGGIAHDFNNTLQAVAGNAELIGRRPTDPIQVRRLARLVLEAAERGGSISRRLLAFARRDALAPEPVEPAAMLTDMRELLQQTLGPSIGVHVIAPSGLPWFLADRRQLETVLLNLASNARDALPDGGDVTLSAQSEIVTEPDHQPHLKPGDYLRLRVTDTGVGMDKATLDRAVEPFFTTKPRGQGTGLGLSMARGFAEQSGGGLAVTSEPHRGTVVTLWLPQTQAAIALPPEAGVTVMDGTRRVLMVDDDPSVREVMMLSLEDAGFVVVGAENGADALAHIDSGARVDAMVTDFAMPGMNGLELIRAAQARSPELSSFLLTGHVGDIEATHGQLSPRGRFTLLQKPIRPAQLARMLTETLS